MCDIFYIDLTLYFFLLCIFEHSIHIEDKRKTEKRKKSLSPQDLEIQALDLYGSIDEAINAALASLSRFAIQYIEQNGSASDIAQIHEHVKTFHSIEVLVTAAMEESNFSKKIESIKQATAAAVKIPIERTLDLFLNAATSESNMNVSPSWAAAIVNIAQHMSTFKAVQVLQQHEMMPAAIAVAHRSHSTSSLLFLIRLGGTGQIDLSRLKTQMLHAVATVTGLGKEELLSALEATIITASAAANYKAAENTTSSHVGASSVSLKSIAADLAASMNTSNSITFLIRNDMKDRAIDTALNESKMNQPCSDAVVQLLIDFVVTETQNQVENSSSNSVSNSECKVKNLYDLCLLLFF